MHRLELRLPPPVVCLLVAAAMWFAARHPLGAPPPTLAAVAVLQWPCALAGALLDLSALLGFRRARTTWHPHRPQAASALVTGGIYRVTRNPMYLGLALLLVAWALRLGQLLPWLGPPLFAAWITRFQIVPEERALAAKFGADWVAYRMRVRRWL
ncbi:methyltransferase family protein [Derxia gummosa]|uniref:Methyltransferase family protein n=1 Tax=Derxia gummosa DSM 723 TaxID=1121388 RepID=A0A8B6X6T1_9BURK|nr:isoprenylcysteine carboxylmethyltransferase family protein [Derxia gummosa]